MFDVFTKCAAAAALRRSLEQQRAAGKSTSEHDWPAADMSVVADFMICQHLAVQSVNLDVFGELRLEFTCEQAILHGARIFRDELMEVTEMTLQIILPNAGKFMIHLFAKDTWVTCFVWR